MGITASEKFRRERLPSQKTLTMAVQSTCINCGFTVVRDLMELTEAEERHLKECSNTNVRVMVNKNKI
jgi:hypothetical protein